MRKPTICICENKRADQLRSYCEADQRLCFRYTDSTIPLLFQSLAIFCTCTARFVSDLFGNHIVGFPMRWLKSNKQSLHVFCTRFEVQVYAESWTRLALITWSYTVTSFCAFYMSRLIGKPTICIGENKDADQLRGNREADQRLCFRYSDSTIPLLLKSDISSF